MTTISDKFNRAFQSKEAIRQALISKGVEVSTDVPFADYAEKINNIESGSDNNPYQQLYMQRTANETNMVGLFAYTPASTTLDLSMLDTSKITDMSRMFSECKVPYLDLTGFDISNVTNMEYMFYYCTSEINIDGWDTSKLTNATSMFHLFTNNNKYLDLSALDFSNVTKANDMFNNCNFDNIDIRNINLDLTKLNFSGSNAPQLFYGGKGTLDLSNWTLNSSITKLERLFYWFSGTEINLTNWKTTNITTMERMFYYNSSLARLIMPDWDMTNTTNTSSFLYNCSKLNYIDLSRSNDATIAKIATLVPAKTLATYGQMIIPADSSQANIEALIAKYWKPVGPRIDMTSCEIITELDEIKPGKTTKLYYSNSEPWYGNDAGVEYISSDESIATIDGNVITSTGVEGTVEITARIADTQEVISEPKVLSVSETDSYPNVIKFRSAETNKNNHIKVNNSNIKLSDMNYNSIFDVYTYDAGKAITSIQFDGSGTRSYQEMCTELIKINTSNMTTMEKMFSAQRYLTELDVSDFDTSKVTNMREMFESCSNLTSLDLSSFNTSNVTDMRSMFAYCNKLTSIEDLNNFDTSNVTNMNNMFYTCKIPELDLSNWNTSNVDDMKEMFRACTELTSLDIRNFDMSKCTKGYIESMNDDYYMFGSCVKLHTLRLDNCSNDTISKIINSIGFPTNAIAGVTRKIYCKEENAAGLTPPTNWEFVFVDEDTEDIYVPGEFKGNHEITEATTTVTKDITDLYQMFYNCMNLTTINDMDTWDTSNVTNMREMFYYCESLTDVDFSSFNTSNVTDMEYMFCICESIKSLDLSSFDTSNVTNVDSMFFGCKSLETLDIRNFNLSKVEKKYDFAEQYCMDLFHSCDNLRVIYMLNCDRDTIMKLTHYTGLPSGLVNGYTRKIYVSDISVVEGLTAPRDWEFKEI